ncbi:MAG: hypothetical protein K8V75_04105 [Methanobrevibacter woesei]|nr:hypothetical protein [Methanobrevibacter woesei]
MTTVTVSKEQIKEAIEVQKKHIEKLKNQFKEQICKDIDAFGNENGFSWGILSVTSRCEEGASQACFAIARAYNNISELTKFTKVENINMDFDEYSELTECEEIDYLKK